MTQSEASGEFLTITGTRSYQFQDVDQKRSFSCRNHNAFLDMMDGALSGKTGFTADAGYCYVGSLRRDKRTFIVALLACGWPNNKGYKWKDTRKLMEYGLEHGMRRMVYVSSGEIYGEGDGSEFTEMSSGYVDCASVRACYPSSKRAAETLCMSYVEEYHADVVIARLSHTYGPGFTESDNRVFAQFIRNVLRGEDIVLKSKGEAFRSWLYVVDAAHAILRLLMDGEKGNAYNVAHSESNISIRQLAELIAGKAHRKVVFDIPEDALQGNTTPITKATFNTDKLKALGWKPLFDVEQGFEHTLAECSAGSHPSSKQ